MEYTKQPIDYPQQIQLLKKRGLIIKDENQALEQLRIISYFRLANYLCPMEQDKENYIFKPHSTFENALTLYYFDKELRALMFTAIQSIEIALRTKIIHYVSMRYGAFWFTDIQLCSNQQMFAENLNHIQQELKRSKEDFILEHFAKYTTPIFPPVWKILEVVSFGTLSTGTAIPFFHSHKSNEEIYIVLSGSGKFQVDDNVFDITGGSVVRVSTNCDRNLKCTSATPLCYICIQAKEGSLGGYTATDAVVTERENLL